MATFNYSIELARVKENPIRNVTFRVKVGGTTILDNQTAGTSGNTTVTGTTELNTGTTALEIEIYNDESNRSGSFWDGEGLKLVDVTFKQGSAITDADKNLTDGSTVILEYAKWTPTRVGQSSVPVADVSYDGDGSFLMTLYWDGTSSLASVGPQA